MRILLANILITLLLVLSFDAAMYWLLPPQYTLRFVEYRPRPDPAEGGPAVGGRGGYPQHYFVAHRTRGFDIGPFRRGRHRVDGVTYPVWSNSLGCFDHEHASYGRYVYFAGDSFAWGYAPFEQTIGSVIERATATQILKCGVTHTGQRHQFEKFVEITERIRALPKAVFVFYVSNDVANDYAHPHSTVIDGWLVDNVSLDDHFERVTHRGEELKQRVADRLKETAGGAGEPLSQARRIKATIEHYSLSANLIRYAMRSATGLVHLLTRTPAPDAAVPLLDLYLLPQASRGKYWYSDNPRARANKDALLAFRRFSAANGIALVVVLIPPKQKPRDTRWYEDVRRFLDNNAIEHVDLAIAFRDRGLAANDLYWEHDNHFSPSGNRAVAEILTAKFPHIFERPRSPN